jgi:hypothetical protein
VLRGTPDHPKFVALQASLRLPRPHVVGLLELLWHFTSRYAPEGDVGRWPDAAIEGGCGWEGDHGALVSALVSCGWLDVDGEHRLVVHDWHHHADRHVRRRLAAHGRRPVGDEREPERRPTGTKVEPEGCPRGAQRATEGRPKGDGTCAPPVPVPEPVPEPEPEPTFPAPAAPAAVVPLARSWSREACDAWIARFGGTAPGGQIGKALKPLVDRHGWQEVGRAWVAYLAQSEAEYASASRFAATYGRWSGAAPPGAKAGGRAGVEARTRANLESWVAGKEGRT